MNLDKSISEGKGIFVFSDPAGANTVLAIIDNLISNGKTVGQDFLIYTNSFKKYLSSYKDYINVIDLNKIKISSILEEFNPKYIFTGTSLENFEHLWRKLGSDKKVRVISFIDHWTSYIERFTYKNEVIFGSDILVINDIAKKEAIQSGIPKKLITVFNNPYYNKVREFSPKVLKESFFKSIGLDFIKKTILFISDDIKRTFPNDDNGNCILGFDEYSVLKDILKSFQSIEKEVDLSNYQFVIKLHPKSYDSKFKQLISEFSPKTLKIFSIKKCDSLTINYYSDFVIGMFSNMVIESLLLGKKTLRVQCGQKGKDILKFTAIHSKVITNKKDLSKKILTFLNLNL